MEKNLLIIGAGSLGAIAKEIAEEIAEEMGTFQKIDFLDDDSDLAIGKFSDIERFAGEYRFGVVALEQWELRRKYIMKLEENCYTIPVLVHPRSFVGKYARIQKGTIVEPMATVQSGSFVGSSVVVSSGCIVDANTYVSDFCNLSAGSIIPSGSALMEPMEIPAGEVYSAESQSDIKSTGMPSYKTDDEWVQKYQSDFGTEPTFF